MRSMESKRFVAVVNRYYERLVWEHDSLEEALREDQSEEHFFIGAFDRQTMTAWLPEITAIGYSKDKALRDLTEAIGQTPQTVKMFKVSD